jgi:hypothetical protein
MEVTSLAQVDLASASNLLIAVSLEISTIVKSFPTPRTLEFASGLGNVTSRMLIHLSSSIKRHAAVVVFTPIKAR